MDLKKIAHDLALIQVENNVKGMARSSAAIAELYYNTEKEIYQRLLTLYGVDDESGDEFVRRHGFGRD